MNLEFVLTQNVG